MSTEHISLREFIERVLDERQRQLELTASNLEHRLSTLNALREDVLRDRAIFIRKEVHDQAYSGLSERMLTLEKAQSRLVGVGTVLVVVAGILGAVIDKLWK